jgi:hypothetical protein
MGRPTLSRLFTLPAEIRTLIFEFIVATSDQLVTFRLDPFQQQYYTTAVQPALTRVSRQIRSESLPIYYACNDFVLHTESPKADDARAWLQSNAAHLQELKRLSFWIRYVPPALDRGTSQGAIEVALHRPKKHHPWLVDATWKWITVMRKPAELNGDAKLILAALTGLAGSVSTEEAGARDYTDVMVGLRTCYIRTKTS